MTRTILAHKCGGELEYMEAFAGKWYYCKYCRRSVNWRKVVIKEAKCATSAAT